MTQQQQPVQAQQYPMSAGTPSVVVVNNTSPSAGRFEFDGGAGSFFLVGIGITLLYIVTLGLALPWCVSIYYKWQTEHTIIDGRRLRFVGSGGSLFGHYIKWWLLTLITLGIYSFWVWPRMVRWATQKQVWS